MTWIRTIPFSEADEKLQGALERQRAPDAGGEPGIVASHTLIPEALEYAFGTFGVLMSPDLPLTRRQHEMITTVVSVVNRCHY
jgi:hypothetical protein